MKSATLFLTVWLTAPVSAQVFERLVTSPFAPVPAETAGGRVVADFDGDGRVDILLGSNAQPSGFWLYHNDGVGRFVVQQTLPGFGGNAVALDFDGDGDLDVCTGNGALLRNDAGVLTVLPNGLGLAQPGRSIAAIDLDGDGADEVLIDWPQLRAFAWNGVDGLVEISGTALPGVTAHADSLAVFDADFDGDQDFALMNGLIGPFGLALYRNDGAAHFAAEPLTQPGTFQVLGALRSGDLDGDGDPDLLAISFPSQHAVLRNDGSGHFTIAPLTANLDTADLLGSVGDWDLDGVADLVGTTGYRSSHDGQLDGTRHPFPAGSAVEGALLADLDGDLDLDAVSASSPAVLWNNGPSSAHGHRPAVAYRSSWPLATVRGIHGSSTWRASAVLQIRADSVDLWRSASSASSYLPLERSSGGDAVLDATMLRDDDEQVTDTVCICSPTGVRLLRLGTPPGEQSLQTPNLGTPTTVDSGRLSPLAGPSLVFGDPTRDGPLIVHLDPNTGFWIDQQPTLPPPTPSTAPAFEQVVVVDVDGDGALDIVHELRVLRSDGQGQFTVAADFAALVPNTASRLLPIDFDGDGDRDLLVYGADSPTVLLRNDGSAFHDASFGHLPTPEFASTDLVSVGDVDGDGDRDLLIARGTGCNLLRNDGGVFERIAGVGPRGVLVDQDADGLPDLFTGSEVLRNRHTTLHQRQVPATGGAWTLEVHAWRTAAAPLLAALAIGPPFAATIPGLGELQVWLDAAVLTTVPLSDGRGDATFAVPLAPALVGLPVAAQALVLDTAGVALTGALRERLL